MPSFFLFILEMGCWTSYLLIELDEANVRYNSRTMERVELNVPYERYKSRTLELIELGEANYTLTFNGHLIHE